MVPWLEQGKARQQAKIQKLLTSLNARELGAQKVREEPVFELSLKESRILTHRH